MAYSGAPASGRPAEQPVIINPSNPSSPRERPLRLLDRVRAEIEIRHYSHRTEEAYVSWIRRFILFHGKRHPEMMGEPEIVAFLSSLAKERRISSVTQSQALSAIIFLCRHVLRQEVGWLKDIARAKPPHRLPVVLTRPEVRDALGHLEGPVWIAAALLYGSGLRLLEALRLRVKDVDFGAHQITVRSGKGQKDRVTMLPAAVEGPLARHLEGVRLQHLQDLGRDAGWVELPQALARKYPRAGQEWPWQWVFPATRTYIDPATRQRRRHHLHESVLQRAVHLALRTAGITKHASCHTLRHSFATHLLQGVALLPSHPEGEKAETARISRAA